MDKNLRDHKQQGRIAVFIDAANLELSAKRKLKENEQEKARLLQRAVDNNLFPDCNCIITKYN